MLEYLGFHLSFAPRAEAVPSDPLGDTVVCGHTPLPFVRLAHGRLVINPGSVGMPCGRTGLVLSRHHRMGRLLPARSRPIHDSGQPNTDYTINDASRSQTPIRLRGEGEVGSGRWLTRVRSSGWPFHQASRRTELSATEEKTCSEWVFWRPR